MGFDRDHWFEESRTEPREATMTDNALTIRRADLADLAALDRLAALDSASPPTGEALVAEVGGELWAALEISTGATIADPFRPSGELVDLLRQHATGHTRDRGALGRLLPRAA
jgi:hypothetical protein